MLPNPFDDRVGGVPDPTTAGPQMVQIGTEGGFLPGSTTIENRPINYVMNKRDITSNINFFMNVPVTPEGGLRFADGISGAGRYVELRAEMDVLLVISNCPQLNNPCNAYDPTPIEVLVFAGAE